MVIKNSAATKSGTITFPRRTLIQGLSSLICINGRNSFSSIRQTIACWCGFVKQQLRVSYVSINLIRPFFYHGPTTPSGPRFPHCRGFMIALRHTTFGRTPLGEWLARRRDLYLTTHNTHTSMPLAGFESTIPASERPQADALDRDANEIDIKAI